jgi:threonine/homoserine/homoserine lactone efflux protein
MPAIVSIPRNSIRNGFVIRLFFIGLVISFLGGLPIGILNLKAMQLAGNHNQEIAWKFVAGVIVVEVLAVIIALHMLEKVKIPERLNTILYYGAAFLFMVLAASFLRPLFKNSPIGQGEIHTGTITFPFMSGLMLSAINPMHIPFWTGWSSYVKDKGYLSCTNNSAATYLSGIILGSILSFVPYIILGQRLILLLPDFSKISGIALMLVSAFVSVRFFLKGRKKIEHKRSLKPLKTG